MDATYPTALDRKPGPRRHLTDDAAEILRRYFVSTHRGPADAARQFSIHYVAARRRFRLWNFHRKGV